MHVICCQDTSCAGSSQVCTECVHLVGGLCQALKPCALASRLLILWLFLLFRGHSFEKVRPGLEVASIM